MPSTDCLVLNELLAVISGISAILFAISEFFGFKKPEGCTSVIQYTGCKCLKVADVVVAQVSPRNSIDGPRPWRRSCDMPRITEEPPVSIYIKK